MIKPRKNKDIQGKTKICKIKLKCSWSATATSAAAPWPKASSPIWSTDSTFDAVFEIDSAATSREEIGNPPHYGTKNKLYEEHIPLIPHRARQMTRDDYLYYDLLIGMDTANIRNMTRIAGGSDSQQKIFKMLSFADYGTNHKLTAARDVADPWYTGDFDATFDDVISGCRGLLEYIKEVYNL